MTLTRPFRVPVDRSDEPDTVAAVMADAALGAHAGSTGDPVLDAHRLLADLAVLALDAPVLTRMAVVVLDDDAATDTAFLGAVLAGLDQPQRVGAAPLVVPRTVDAAVDAVDPASSDGGFVEDEDDPDDVLVREFVDDDAIVEPAERARRRPRRHERRRRSRTEPCSGWTTRSPRTSTWSG